MIDRDSVMRCSFKALVGEYTTAGIGHSCSLEFMWCSASVCSQRSFDCMGVTGKTMKSVPPRGSRSVLHCQLGSFLSKPIDNRLSTIGNLTTHRPPRRWYGLHCPEPSPALTTHQRSSTEFKLACAVKRQPKGSNPTPALAFPGLNSNLPPNALVP